MRVDRSHTRLQYRHSRRADGLSLQLHADIFKTDEGGILSVLGGAGVDGHNGLKEVFYLY